MGRWYIPGSGKQEYPPLNQCHDRTDFNQMRTWSAIDDKNQAAVMVRGCNTSYNYAAGGRNFREMPMGNPNGMDNFYPTTRWHQTTSAIRNEPVYRFAPMAGGWSARKW
jgi:hypothetical protein